MEVIQKPEVAEKREFLDKEQKTEEVSRVIDRPIDFKFSLAVYDDNKGNTASINRARVGFMANIDGENDYQIGPAKTIKKLIKMLAAEGFTKEIKGVSEDYLKFSKSLSEEFNKILEDKTGVAADKVYSDAKASVAGRNKGRFKFFIPPSAEDFVGLLYATLTKGKKGDKQMNFYKETLLNPYAKAMASIAKERIALTSAYKAILKTLKGSSKKLT